MRHSIGVVIVTGALGSGKTSLVLEALSSLPLPLLPPPLPTPSHPNPPSEPREEVWACLMTELGNHLPVRGTGRWGAVEVIGGGCAHCTLAGPVGLRIVQIVRQLRPDRLFLEVGLGTHLDELLGEIRGGKYGNMLHVDSVVAVVNSGAMAKLEGERGGTPFWDELKESMRAHCSLADYVYVVENGYGNGGGGEIVDFLPWAGLGGKQLVREVTSEMLQARKMVVPA